jgi:hypothetical protein
MRKIAFGRDEGWSHSAVTRRVKRQRSLDSGISVSLRSLLINRADYESATVTSRDITVTARDEGVHGLVVTNSSRTQRPTNDPSAANPIVGGDWMVPEFKLHVHSRPMFITVVMICSKSFWT